MFMKHAVADETELTTIEPAPNTQVTAASPQWRPRSFHWLFVAVPLLLNLLLIGFAVVLLQTNQHDEIKDLLQFSSQNAGAYMLWQCGPLAVAVIAWLLWEVIYVDICRFEAFHQMSHPDGITIKESLSTDYINTFTPFVPILALRMKSRRHITVALASIIYMLASCILPITVAAMFTIDWVGTTDQLSVNITIASVYCTLVIAALITICGISLVVILCRRQTRLYGDPAGIAGLAALLSDSDLLDKFKVIRSYDTQARIDEVLGSYRVRLCYKQGNGSSYQICLLDPQENHPIPPERPFKQTRTEAHSWWLRGRSFLAVWAISTVPTFLYWSNSYINIPTNLMVARICYTLVVVLKSVLAGHWQLKLSIMEPFYQLKTTKRMHNPPTSPRTNLQQDISACEASSSSPLIGSEKALNLNFSASPVLGMLQAMSKGTKSGCVWLVSVYVFLLQLSVIYTPSAVNTQLLVYSNEYSSDNSSDSGYGIPGYTDSNDYSDQSSDDSTYMHFALQVNSYFVLAMLFIQLFLWLSLLFLIMRHKRRPIMPRKPFTLSSTILYLCNSRRLLEDLKDTSTMSRKEREAHMAEHERDYAFGWVQPENDGKTHLAVDRVEDIKSQFEFQKWTM